MSSADLVPLEPGKKPRRWQEEAMLSIRRYLAQHSDVLVSAATGTGKGTLIASLVVKAVRAGKRILFLVHRDELIEDVMARALAIEPRGEWAGKVQGPTNQVDARAVFASVQTLRGPARLNQVGRFDFVVTDEAHHATAKSYQAIYRRVRLVNPAARHIGFTATPFRSTQDGKTTGLGAVFECLAYQYSLQDAITEGALCPVVCIGIETDLDLSEVDPEDEAAIEKLTDTPERNAIVVAKYREHLEGRPAIVFCTSVAHAKTLASLFTDAGIPAAAVWGAMPKRARADTIAQYKSGAVKVLVNKDLLTEGFDAPETEGVLLDRPTNSVGLFAQMVGRVTRLSPATGKTRGLVLDFVGNASRHDLATFANLTAPGESQRVGIGAIVRHRRRAELHEGTVVGLAFTDPMPDPPPAYPDRAEVLWQGQPQDWHPCAELVLLREPPGQREIAIVPVVGVREFSVLLFGEGSGHTVAWYKYEGANGLYLTARAKGLTVQMRKVSKEEWVAHERLDEVVSPVAGPGPFADVRAAAEKVFTTHGRTPDRFNKDWQRDPATDAQLAALKRWGLGRRTNLSKGEASMLLETKITIARVNDSEPA